MTVPQRFHSPTLPFLRDLAVPFLHGSTLLIQGIAYDDPVRMGFMIDLLSAADIALCCSVQFRPNNKNFIAFTSRNDGIYFDGMRKDCPFVLGQQFRLEITCEDRFFEIKANEATICHFPHRIKPSDIGRLSIKGSLICRDVVVTSPDSVMLNVPIYEPPPPYHEEAGPLPSKIPPPIPPPPKHYEKLLASKIREMGISPSPVQNAQLPYPIEDKFPACPYPSDDFSMPRLFDGSNAADSSGESSRKESWHSCSSSSGYTAAMPSFRGPLEVKSGSETFYQDSSSSHRSDFGPPTPQSHEEYHHGHTVVPNFRDSHEVGPFCHHACHNCPPSGPRNCGHRSPQPAKTFLNITKNFSGRVVPFCLNLGDQHFEFPQKLSITGTPVTSMFNSKNRFEINFKHRNDYVLHVNPRFDEKFTVLNSTEYNVWQTEIRVPFPFKSGRTFHMDIVAGNPIKIYVDGKELASFQLRSKRPIDLIEVNDLGLKQVSLTC